MLTAVRFIKSKREGEESSIGVELYKKEILEKRIINAENEFALKNPEADSIALNVLGTLIHYIITDHNLLKGKGRGKGQDKETKKSEEKSIEKNDNQSTASSAVPNEITTVTTPRNTDTNIITNSKNSNDSTKEKKKKVLLDEDTYGYSEDCMYFKGDVLEALSDCILVLKRFPILLAQYKIFSLGSNVYSTNR